MKAFPDSESEVIVAGPSAWGRGRKVLLFANTEWYLFNFRRSLATALREAGFEVILVSPPGPYGQRLLDAGFRWIPAPMARLSLNPLRELGLLVWLVRLLLTEKVSLVHGFTIKCVIYGALAARLAGVKARVSAVAGMGYVFINTSLRARGLRLLLRPLFQLALSGRASRLILQNRDDMDIFLRAGLVNPARIRLIAGSGVNCKRFRPRNSPRQPGPFRVLLASRLLWDKGLAEYAEAARLLKIQGRVIAFLLAGDPDPGNPASVEASIIKGWEESGLLECLGHVDDMVGLFSKVDVVVLPSYREGLPKSLIEAAACGLPLVTTDVPGCREVVTDGEDGLLVPVRDAHALAVAIARLQDEPEFAQSLGRTAREKVFAQFDEKRVITSTLTVYRELLEAQPPVKPR
ncbi:MAG: glycosyltransferase family 4 protein [Methylococcaceae bacterium]|nr:glycosyltransferase family 4 protein [Methylococcaceae bacterium]